MSRSLSNWEWTVAASAWYVALRSIAFTQPQALFGQTLIGLEGCYAERQHNTLSSPVLLSSILSILQPRTERCAR